MFSQISQTKEPFFFFFLFFFLFFLLSGGVIMFSNMQWWKVYVYHLLACKEAHAGLQLSTPTLKICIVAALIVTGAPCYHATIELEQLRS